MVVTLEQIDFFSSLRLRAWLPDCIENWINTNFSLKIQAGKETPDVNYFFASLSVQIKSRIKYIFGYSGLLKKNNSVAVSPLKSLPKRR